MKLIFVLLDDYLIIFIIECLDRILISNNFQELPSISIVGLFPIEQDWKAIIYTGIAHTQFPYVFCALLYSECSQLT
jgi:hypothetical protein